MSQVSPLDFQGLVSSFHYHSINDSHDTISCVKCLIKAWLQNKGTNLEEIFLLLLPHKMNWTIYFCFEGHQI